MKVLLGITGSVASIVAKRIVDGLTAAGHEVKVVMTEKSRYFCKIGDFNVPVLVDKDEWQGDFEVHKSPVLHIQLREWADLMLIAPLSANTLGKLANGLADNLLTCVARAWDMRKPVIVAPAMNTYMWQHPATKKHLDQLAEWIPNFQVIDPIEKMLACGTKGLGAMAQVQTIVEAVAKIQTLGPVEGGG